MIKQYDLERNGEVFKIVLERGSYNNGKGIAIGMSLIEKDGSVEPYDVMTTNILHAPCGANKAYIKVGSYEKFIKDNNLGKPTGLVTSSGWNTYVEYEFYPDIFFSF